MHDAIEQALDRQISLDFDDTPLPDAIDQIRKSARINILLDKTSITAMGLSPDELKVTRKLYGISLRSSLKLILGAFDLTYVERNEVLLITSPDPWRAIVLRAYNVADLVKSDPAAAGPLDDPALLMQTIETTLEPTTWTVAGGDGSLAHFDGLLVVSHHAEIHGRLERLLQSLRQIRAAAYPKDELRIWVDPTLETSAAVREALDARISLDFVKTPLATALATIENKCRVTVSLDLKALEEADLTADAPVDLVVENVSVQNALALMLRPLDLVHQIRGNTVVITTNEKCSCRLFAAVYGIRDLVDAAARDSGRKPGEACHELVRALTSTVAPTSWSKEGGPAAVSGYFASPGAVVILQTSEAHEQVASLLAELRLALAARTAATAAAPAPADSMKLVVYNLPRLADAAARQNDSAAVRASRAEQLARLLPEVISPQSWQGSEALLRVCGDQLIVRQKVSIHREIEQFLDQLQP